MAELITMGDFVTQSERQAAQRLRDLPDDWLVICNKEMVLPSGRSYEIDFIVVGAHKIFVIDEKSWRGPIYGNENVWIVQSSQPRQNPLQKLGHIARQLAGSLRDRVPYLYNLAARVHFVHEAVLMSAGDLEFRVNDPRCREHVLRLAEVNEELRRLDQQRPECDLASCRTRLKQVLTDLRDRPKHPAKIDTFSVNEFLGQDAAGVRSYLATHDSGKRRLLKLFPVDPIEGPTEQLLRDFNAASIAAERGVAPHVDPYFRWNDGRFLAIPFHWPEGDPFCVDGNERVLADSTQVLELIRTSFRALQTLHDCGLVHRALNPRRIYKLRNQDAVQFIDFGFAHVDQRKTIAEDLDSLQIEDPYLAPECRIGFGLGERASDVFSLTLSLCAFLSGQEPDRAESTVDWVEASMRDVTKLWTVEIAETLVSLFRLCAADEPRTRPTAQNLHTKLTRTLEATRRGDLAPLPATLGDGQYKVIRRLGEGGSAVTYLVEDSFYGGQYVLKKIKNTEFANTFAGTEFQALRDLNHASLPRVYDVRQPKEDFHLKFQFIPGVELGHCMSEYRYNPERLVELALPLLDALDYLEQRGIAHRDISPKNIIIPEDRTAPPCLIDFGLAKMWQDLKTSAVGTPLYRAPEVDQGVWKPASDVYSLAVILLEAISGELPFEVVDGLPDKRSRRPASSETIAAFGAPVIECLQKAMKSVDERYPTAAAFRDALKDAWFRRQAVVGEPQLAVGEQVCLDWVRSIRGLYRNSAGGNSDNRGLDSAFARSTYIPTLLDAKLLPEILQQQKRLVFLTGNPGDGKTAFLEIIRNALEAAGTSSLMGDRFGWRAVLPDCRFEAIYDASESRGDESSDQVLRRLLDPFSGTAAPDWSVAPVTLVAINDGRLYEFLETHSDNFSWLRNYVDEQSFGDGEEVTEVAIVDLKRRSLTGTPDSATSLFRVMASSLLNSSAWDDCGRCQARLTCHIKFNVDSLKDSRILGRLETLFLTQHWRRERRATIRDVRSALAFVLTSNFSCEDVHSERNVRASTGGSEFRPYYHSVFNLLQTKDEMLEEMAILDPATRPHARLDRFLHYHREEGRRSVLAAMFLEIQGRSSPPDQEMLEESNWHAAMKRRLYFERAGEDTDDKLRRWDLPSANTLLLPYLFLDRFMDALAGRIPLQILRDQLLTGISRSEGIPAQATHNKLSLSLSRNAREELTVIRQIDTTQFRCDVPTARHCEYVENIPDALELTYIPQNISLPITLDMFEILMRMAEGYTPGSVEFEPFLIELNEFKARLVRLGVAEVLLLEGRSRLHRVANEANQIVYKGAM